jgi:hypothetical protein
MYSKDIMCVIQWKVKFKNIWQRPFIYIYIYMIYLLTAIVLTPGGSSTVKYSKGQYSKVKYSRVEHSTGKYITV